MRVRPWAMLLALALASRAGAQEHRIVAFRVSSTTDIPIPNAVIGIQEWGIHANTDSTGRVRIVANRGKARVRVRAIGFAPFDSTISIADDQNDFVVRLRTLQQLSAVEVRATRYKPERYDSTTKFDEFYRRRALGWGKFFTREDIERTGEMHSVDLLRFVNGVRVNRQPGYFMVRFPRCGIAGSAPPGGKADTPDEKRVAVFVDGQRLNVAGLDYLDNLSANDIEAMEVYRGPAELPADARGNTCAAIYVWTRYSLGSVLQNAKKP